MIALSRLDKSVDLMVSFVTPAWGLRERPKPYEIRVRFILRDEFLHNPNDSSSEERQSGEDIDDLDEERDGGFDPTVVLAPVAFSPKVEDLVECR